jgi:hypothetical protein
MKPDFLKPTVRLCRTCGTEFVGRYAARFCRIKCRPSYIRDHEKIANMNSCETCGVSLINRRPYARFCRPECRSSYVPVVGKHLKKCETCGSEYWAGKRDSRFCKPICSPAHQRWFNHHRYKRYGWTAEQYEKQLASQGGSCAICQEIKIGLIVDHSHTSGHVRGLLCNRCNMVLGRFKDDLEFLKKAIKYLELPTLAAKVQEAEIEELAH